MIETIKIADLKCYDLMMRAYVTLIDSMVVYN